MSPLTKSASESKADREARLANDPACWWTADVVYKGGMLSHPNGTPLVYDDLPAVLRDAMAPHLETLRDDRVNELRDDPLFYGVGHHGGGSVHRAAEFKGYQVGATMPGVGVVIFPQVHDSRIGGLVVAAGRMDPLLHSRASAASWVLHMVAKQDAAARRWLGDMGDRLKTLPVRRSKGGRPAGKNQHSKYGVNARMAGVQKKVLRL